MFSFLLAGEYKNVYRSLTLSGLTSRFGDKSLGIIYVLVHCTVNTALGTGPGVSSVRNELCEKEHSACIAARVKGLSKVTHLHRGKIVVSQVDSVVVHDHWNPTYGAVGGSVFMQVICFQPLTATRPSDYSTCPPQLFAVRKRFRVLLFHDVHRRAIVFVTLPAPNKKSSSPVHTV